MSLTRMIYLHAITPVHSGTGQTAEVIDLPIAREKATGYPLIPASSFKGVTQSGLRTDANKEEMDAIFGTQDAAGALCFTDQRILCLPVRSYFGTFAYVTCHLVLSRLQRDAKAMGVALPFAVSKTPVAQDTQDTMPILLPDKSDLKRPGTPDADKVYLEDLDLTASINSDVTTIAQGLGNLLFTDDPAAFVSRFGVVSDEAFSFLCETATEITARVSLEKDTKTVRRGGLWYEEAAPAETIFCGPVVVEARRQNDAANILSALNGVSTLQVGGNASIGRGLCRMIVGADR